MHLTPASVASGPPDASRCADGRSARQQQASLSRRLADVASKRPVAQRKGDGPRPNRAYARRSSDSKRRCSTRRPAARGVHQPRRPHASPLFRLVSDHLHRLQRSATTASSANTARGAPSSRRSPTSFWRVACWSTASPASAVMPARTSTPRLLVQAPLLLSELPRQAAGALNAVARHDTARAGAAPTGGAHHSEAATCLLSLPPPPARRDRPRRRPDRHRRHLHAHR